MHKRTKFHKGMRSLEATTGDNIIDTLSANGVTPENKTIHTPLLFSPFKVGLFVVSYR